MQALLIITHFPDTESAQNCARNLVESKLAACVNVMPSCHSVYTWKGGVETAEEVPLLVKAAKQNYQAVEQAIQHMHPYELPEIIAVAIDRGLPAYLNWISDVSRST